MRLLYIFLLYLAFLANSWLIYLLATKRTERSAATIFFIIFLALINLWGLPQLFISLLNLHGTWFVYLDKLSSFGYVFTPVAFLLFSLAFTNRKAMLENGYCWLLLIIPSVSFLFLANNTNLIIDHRIHHVHYTNIGTLSPPGLLFPYFVIWFVLLMGIALVLMVKKYQSVTTKTKRRQLFMLVAAIFIPLFLGTLTDGILPIFGYYMFRSAVPLTSVMSGIICYAILRYQFFENSPMPILSSVGDGIITVDNNGLVIQLNEPAEKLLGVKDKSFVGQPVGDVFILENNKGDIVPASERPIELALKHGTQITGNYNFVGKNKEKIPFVLTATPVKVKDNIMGASVMFHDVRKEQEREQLKDTFIGIASHELKSPIAGLRVIVYFLKEYLEKHGDEESQFYIKSMEEKVNNVLHLMDKLLDYSKIETGKFILNKQLFDMDLLLRETIENIEAINPKYRITLEGKTVGQVYADKERIFEVLVNVINNAIKYSPNAHTVAVSVKQHHDIVTVAVKDFGIGMTKETKKKIFNKFYRAMDPAVHTTGLGVGLYIAAEIINAHKGKIWVESEKGKGSTFFFTIPVK